MSELIVTFFLGLSLWAYVVSGGADFGIGILELLSPKNERACLRKVGEKALAPVWEANHVWIIVALVIVFVAFPGVHVQITTSLHIPLVIMLIGIVLRGTAFTFRYYDIGEASENQALSTWLFRSGSLIVPFLFGHLAAAMARGQMLAEPTNVWDSYMAPWLGLFPFATGLFTIVLFAWLASVFLVGEVPENVHQRAIKRAKRWTVYMVVAGAFVTASALYESIPWLAISATRLAVQIAIVLNTCAVIGLWFTLPTSRVWTMRLLCGAIVAAILGGYWGAIYPIAIELKDGSPITWANSIAPGATLEMLAIALIVAGSLIIPGLAWLYRLFKMPIPE